MTRIFVVILITALCSSGFPAYAQAPSAQEIKIKQKVLDCDIDQRVKVKLKSNETLRGHLAEIKTDSFVLQLLDSQGRISTKEIDYSQVSKFSKIEDQTMGKTVKHSAVGTAVGVGVIVGMLMLLSVAFGG